MCLFKWSCSLLIYSEGSICNYQLSSFTDNSLLLFCTSLLFVFLFYLEFLFFMSFCYRSETYFIVDCISMKKFSLLAWMNHSTMSNIHFLWAQTHFENGRQARQATKPVGKIRGKSASEKLTEEGLIKLSTRAALQVMAGYICRINIFSRSFYDS